MLVLLAQPITKAIVVDSLQVCLASSDLLHTHLALAGTYVVIITIIIINIVIVIINHYMAVQGGLGQSSGARD